VLGCDLIIGSRGWRHDAWRPGFYPEDLPVEWELTYYANEHRGVLVPAEVMEAATPDDARVWVDDVHEQFRFFAELRAGAAPALRPVLEALGGHLAGVLLRADGSDPAAAGAALPAGPCVCTDLPAGGLPLAWDGTDGQDAPAGCVGLLPEVPMGPRALRARIEAFLARAGHHPVAFLAFPPAAAAPAAMGDARIIAELLGA
jgi:hypothetical protein